MSRSLASLARARSSDWTTVVGIEVHALLKTPAKLFSDTRIATLADTPNSHVSAFDAAFPGTLPILNVQCVEAAVRAAVALRANVQSRSTFDRKHYFYPDLPSGYQITQKYAPYALGGSLLLQKAQKQVRLKQLQIEQDTAKSHAEASTNFHAVNLNRANAPLVEIVSEPDMRSADEAADFVRSLQTLLRTVGVSNAQMEDGSLRCDVNVSVHRPGESFGTRCEVKNLNSVRSLIVAINYEVGRQTEAIQRGEKVLQETRGFDEDRAHTYSMRSKEDAPDYRYLPDSNLPPLIVDDLFIEKVKATMPELPAVIIARLRRDYQLSETSASSLVALDLITLELDQPGPSTVRFFESAARHGQPQTICNWIVNELCIRTDARDLLSKITAEHIASVAEMVRTNEITYAVGRTILEELLARPLGSITPRDLVQELGLNKVDASDELEDWCHQCIEQLASEAAAFRGGNERVIGKMVGYVRRLSGGRADPTATETILRRLL